MANPFNMTGSSKFTGSVDAANDSVPFWQNSTGEAFWITNQTWNNISGSVVGTTDSQTLTNKTLTSPTISGPTLSGTLIGTYTIGGTPTFPASVVTTTGTQTLTNKTLTSPTINTATISNPTLTVDAVTGYTSADTGTVYGMSVTSGQIGAGALANNAVTGPAIATGAVGATAIAPGAIELSNGYAQITSGFSTTSGSDTQISGLTATVTVPAGGRSVKITTWSGSVGNSTANTNVRISLWDGVVGSGTLLTASYFASSLANNAGFGSTIAVVTPSAGSHTYNVGIANIGGGTATYGASSGVAGPGPAFLLVEAI